MTVSPPPSSPPSPTQIKKVADVKQFVWPEGGGDGSQFFKVRELLLKVLHVIQTVPLPTITIFLIICERENTLIRAHHNIEIFRL